MNIFTDTMPNEFNEYFNNYDILFYFVNIIIY